MQLNINTDAVVKHTNRLEKMHKSSLPIAIRGALNKAAFDVKKSTLQKSADKSFIKRSPNFFKAFSKVEKADGFDVDSMHATVGMVSQGLQGGGNNYAVKDLEQQEDGGKISGRSFIPTDKARGGSNSKPVRAANRITKIKKIIKAVDVRSSNARQRYIKAAIKADETGGYVLGNMRSGRQTLSRVDKIVHKTSKGHKIIKIKRTPLFTFRNKRSVKVKGTDFSKRAALESGLHIEQFFIDEAVRQFNKLK